MIHEATGWKSKALLAAGLVVYLLVAARTLPKDNQLDLFVYRAGAKLAWEGESPYDTPRIQLETFRQFPKDVNFVVNCGFFLPPQGIVLFAPFAKIESWPGAEAGWFAVLTAFGILCGTLAWTFGRAPPNRGTGWAVIVLVLLLNPITMPSLVVGQTTLLFAGCIAFGQYCFESGSPRFGCFLWALIFFKPHLALPFLALAAILGGWKRFAGIVFFVVLLNLLGGLLTRGTFSGSIQLFREYLDYIASAHKTVVFNLVEANYQIPSWNRILVACGGPAINLTIAMTLGGFAVWAALIAARLRFAAPWRDLFDRTKLDQAYLLAAAVVAALFFAQVLAYEMILLVLLSPLILQSIDAARRNEAWVIIALVVFLLIPLTTMDQIADRMGLGEESRGRLLLRSHKCFGMAALAIFLLIRGPRQAAPAPVDKSVAPATIIE